MAIENAKTLNVRIKNKYDSYENWASSSLVLEAGEIAIAYSSVDIQVDNGTAKHPFLLMKVGDGEHTFADLPWMSAKAADVLSVCKNTEDLTAFVNSVIADAGIASDDAMEALAERVTDVENELNTEKTGLKARVATAEEAITALELLVGDKTVKTQIEEYVAALKLGETYAAKAHTHTKAEITDFAHNHEMSEVNGLAAEFAKKVDKEVNKSLIADSEIERLAGMSTGANKVEASATNGSIKIDGVETVVYTHPEKHAIADVDGLQGALDGKQDVIPENTYDAYGAAAAAVADEAALRQAADEALQNQINTIMNNPDTEGVIDSINEFTQYIADHGEIAEGFRADIDANAKAIEDHETLAAQTYETKEDATAKFDEVKELVNAKAVQPDWNQNDSAAADYVKNRTHYDGESYEDVWSDVSTTTGSSSTSFNGKTYYPSTDLSAAWFYLDRDVQYIVVVDGVEYKTTVDNSMLGFSDYPNIPVMICERSMGSMLLCGAEPNKTYVVSVKKIISDLKQLDEKFIPATIARASAVEGVAGRMTTAEGKIEALEDKVGDKKVSEAIAEAIEAIPQADWNQNDPEAADYVKNRPFYEEGEETTFGEFSLTNVHEGSQGWQYLDLEENIPDDVLGRTDLKLEVDGADVYSGNGYKAFDGVTIGDATGVRVSFEQPGKIGFYNAYGVNIASHTIRLFAGDMTIKQLDEKFIPATIARTAAVEAVKADVDGLAAIAKTGSTDDLVQGALTLVFDCGGATNI